MSSKKLITQVIKHSEYILLTIILISGFMLRFYNINSPIADWHSWRQADTASVSKEFVNNGVDIFYPTYHDISTIQTGIFNPEGYRFVEVPIYNVFHAKLFQYFPAFSIEVWGRLLSSFSVIISAYFLFLLGKRLFGSVGGLLSSFFFLFIPFNIYFSRVILPEPLAVSLAISALWFFVRYYDFDSKLDLLAAALLFSLSLLVKPFTFFYGIPMIYLALKKHGIKKTFFKPELIIFGLVVFLPTILWRNWISNFPEGVPLYKWTLNGDGIRFKPAFFRWILAERLGMLILGVWGLVPLVFAILNIKKDKIIVHFLLFSAFIYTAIFATANVRHDYYQIVIIPAVAIALAYGSTTLWNLKAFSKHMNRGVLILSIILMLVVGGQQASQYYKINHPEIVETGIYVDKMIEEDALVIAPYNGDTAFLYHIDRWGWPYKDRVIEYMVANGADYYVSINKGDEAQSISEKYEVIEENDTFILIDLKKPKNI